MLDKNSLERRPIIEDSVVFAKPLIINLRYKRLADIDRVLYREGTENDRNPVISNPVIRR